jgi:glutamine amidotransferase
MPSVFSPASTPQGDAEVCRHLVYLGPPVSLGGLLLEPECSLLRQSFAPRHQTQGRINADGFGVGWYDRRRDEPALYRRATPMWTDRSFASIAGLIESEAVVAAVRSASPGFPVEESGNAPFNAGRWLFSMNGFIAGYQDGIGAALRADLPERLRDRIVGNVDSEVLFLLTLARIEAGASPGEALADVVATVQSRTGGRFNLLLCDGQHAVATACGNSLFVHDRGPGVTVASEPHDDDPSWRAVPGSSLVEATSQGVTITPLAQGRSR